MTQLFVRTTKDFDPTNVKGALICSEDRDLVHMFLETGYDEAEDQTALFWEVQPTFNKAAGYEDLVEVLESLGITRAEDGLLEQDETLPPIDNIEMRTDAELFAIPEVIKGLSDRGFDAYQGYTVMANMEPPFTALWMPDTFILSAIPTFMTDSEASSPRV